MVIDNKDSKKRYRADVLIEDHIAKIEEKIEKECEKAHKRFGDAFDRQQFVTTNARVLEHQKQIDEIHERYADCMNRNDLDGLKQLILDLGIVCSRALRSASFAAAAAAFCWASRALGSAATGAGT